jgi:hypothetical protein
MVSEIGRKVKWGQKTQIKGQNAPEKGNENGEQKGKSELSGVQ